ncbi:MAG: hypothetical protein HUJ25_02305 [Crocinitomicaceae bacterium]|nr:hypothetical protein [Crocinitomicaceae bacterium]
MVVPLIFGAILMDTKDYLDTRELEGKSAEDRATMIVDDLKEENILSEQEANSVYSVVLNKEVGWSELKDAGNHNTAVLEDKYVSDLLQLGITDEKMALILSHDYGQVRPVQGPNMAGLSVGFICAFITGLFACKWMIALVKRAQLKYFSYYCFIVGVAAIILSVI